MSTIKTTNITHASNSGTSNVVLDSSGNVTTAGNITPTGDLILASGKGLDFSATAGPTNGSATSEKLLDYEEGDWTPALGGENGDGTITYHYQHGKYIKIGKLVNCYFNISVNAVSSTPSAGTGLIKGLPYTIIDHAVAPGCGGSITFYYGLDSDFNQNATPTLIGRQNTTELAMRRVGYNVGSNSGVVDAAEFTSGDYISGFFNYIAA
tara:strand:+ start:589 stop:1215 length:627 start_codon:yes stop_codon:yes gene_type:complete